MVEYNWAFVAAAYSITWIVVLGYTVHLFRTIRTSRKALERATAAGYAAAYKGVES